jgi:phosphate transport system substrate-binding protein
VTRTSTRWAIAPAVAALALSLAACGGDATGGGDGGGGTVVVDGSSTVLPLSDAASELLSEEDPDIQVTVGEAGTGGGFERFCKGETDISDASRPIKTDEPAEGPACDSAGLEYTELHVATDALTIVVHKDLAVDCLTTDQLEELWNKGSKVDNWKDLDPSFPDQKISFFGPGADSGTFDYFTDEINGEEGVQRDGVEQSENDGIIVQGVSENEGAVGYFGYTYYEENTDKLKALEVDSGAGCVAPSAETAQDGTYTPLARPLFIYVANKKYTDNEAVKTYVDFYVENLATIAEQAKFIPLNDEQTAETQTALAGIGG